MTRRAHPSLLLVATAAVGALAACGGDGTGPAYDPDLPTSWAAAVNNPWFPVVPGRTLTYEGDTPDGLEVIVVEMLNETHVVNGVTARAVRDRVYVDGALVEDTYDWYAQDPDGNVWYLGEDSKEIENGQVVSTDGSWEWGVDGALPGILMWADPAAHIGEEYRQEYYEGEAEDWGKVVSVDQTVTASLGTYTGCIRTEEWNALESGTLENKWYCPGLGFTRETTADGEVIELVEVTG